MLNRFLPAVIAALVLSAPQAVAQTSVKFALDWLPQAPQSVFLLAKDRGYFADEGIDITITRGFGSGDTIGKVAAGTYDIGLADISSLVSFNAKNPDKALVGFYMYYDSTLTVVVGRKDRGIAKPKDLEGKTIASPEGEGSRVLFPAFAAVNDIDVKKVTWETVSPQLRETILSRGSVDAIGGFTSTVLFNLEKLGVTQDQITVMPYADFGLDLYGSTLLVKPAYAAAHPEVMKGFVRAVVKATREAIADPAKAIAALKKFDNLTDEAIEVKRFKLVRDKAFLTANVRKNGFGAVTPDRLNTLVEVNAKAFNFATKPDANTLFDSRYLPPAAERMP